MEEEGGGGGWGSRGRMEGSRKSESLERGWG